MLSSTFSKIWILIIICLLIGGGIFAYQNWQLLEETKPETSEQLEELEKLSEELSEQIEGLEEIADWQVYRNEEFGFEIKYPADWYVFSTPKEKTKLKLIVRFRNAPQEEISDVSDEQISLWIEGGLISEWVEAFEEMGDVEEIDLGLGESYKAIIPEMGTYIGIFKEYIYTLFQELPVECKFLECEIFNQMLSTFSFIE